MVTLAVAVMVAIGLQYSVCRGDAPEIACHADLEPGMFVDTTTINPFQSDDISSYSGVYSFGSPESESSILVVFWENGCVVQHKQRQFHEDSGQWIWKYLTVEPVALEGNHIISPGWDGEFVSCTIYARSEVYRSSLVSTPYPVKEVHGLLIRDSPIDIRNEFGVRRDDGFQIYPRSSVALLGESDVQGKSREELQIMRNEIFARYGYQFKPGGSMDNYFREKFWYVPCNGDAYQFLTEIEKANIVFIRSHE